MTCARAAGTPSSANINAAATLTDFIMTYLLRAFVFFPVRLSETGAIVDRQSVDLGPRKFCGDCPHAPVHIVAPITRGIRLELQDEVFLPLLGKNGGLDR